jgi:hypothetical protein
MGADLKIIALNAIPKSGKSTVADALEAGHDYVHLSIGDAMRAALTGLGYPLELFTDPDLKEVPKADMYGLSPRQMMISLGAWGRGISPSFWIDRMRASAPSFYDAWVIADVGTEDEAIFVRMVLGGPIVRLVRPGVEPIPDGRVLLEPDLIFPNDGTPEEAAAALDLFAENWRTAA